MLADLAFFIAVVEARSFRIAAEQIGISPATITRRIQALEQQLNCQLLIRSSKQMVLTEAGERLYQENAPHLQRVHWQLSHFQSEMTELAGNIRVIAPNNLSRTVLLPMFSSFMEQHPNINICVYAGSQIEALAQHRADLAIRVEPAHDTNLRSRKLVQLRTILLARPDHAQTLAPVNKAEDIAKQVTVSGLQESSITLCHLASQQEHACTINPRFFINDLAAGLQMLTQHAGIMLCPISEALAFIEKGDLVQVYAQWQGNVRDVYALWNAQNFMLPRTRALVDHLVTCFEHKQTEYAKWTSDG